ncbi:MAG: large conductance mechanosensitive channel protein MscL [Actinomycetota bacterium]|nr:large conductance mechanosensitive channel protein MscL [Actinomycetota bacterium]
MLKDFKAFIMKGNLVEIAVAFTMGLAFAAVVASFVADVITPIVGAIFGQPDFSAMKIDIGKSAITYGNFLNALLTFAVVAFVMFTIVKTYNRAMAPKATTTKECPFCMTSIPIAASRCPACTSQLESPSSSPAGG